MNFFETKQAILKENLVKMREEGFRVFISRDAAVFAYGLIADGRDLVYVQPYDYGTSFQLVYPYLPNRKCGCGVQVMTGVKELSPEIFAEATIIGRKYALAHGCSMYFDIDHYLKTRENGDRYREISAFSEVALASEESQKQKEKKESHEKGEESHEDYGYDFDN